MLTVYQWSPLLVGLAAPLLVWLVVTSGTNTPRTTRRVSLAAALAVLVELAAVFTFAQLQSVLQVSTDGYTLVYLVIRFADAMATVLAVAAWTVLFIATARTGNRGQLVVLTVVFALALALQSGLGAGQFVIVPPLQTLLRWLVRLGTTGQLLEVLLAHVAALAVLICAYVRVPPSVAPAPAPNTPVPAGDAGVAGP